MNVLGIHYGHNSTVCLMQDGKVTFCQSEERFLRIKNVTGFPRVTLEHVYKNLVPAEKIDQVVLFQQSVYGYLYLKRHNFEPFQYGGYIDEVYVEKGLKRRLLETDFGWNLRAWRMARKEKDADIQQEALDYFSRESKLPASKIRMLDHHTSHAYSCFPNIQDWGRALVFVLDGSGDGACASVYRMQDGHLELISRTDHRHSLGYYYAATTAILGMKAGEHEFKVMGLAPYAKPRYYEKVLSQLSSLIKVNDRGEFESVPNPEKLVETLDGIFIHQRFDNVAGAIQALTEKLVIDWIEYWIKKTGIHDIAVTGGVFMNVKASQKVAERPAVTRYFIMPSAADESCAIGAAVWGSLQLAPQSRVEPLRDLYLGVEYKDPEIEAAIRETGAADRYQILKPENINREVGTLLAQNHVLSRCSGRMEWGARALGNRSILANASDFRNLQKINDAIKSRDFWMPFTPSILEEDMPRYIQNHERIFAPYMCITFDSTPEARNHLAAAIHPRDLTVRPQCVMKSWNPAYHEIISTYKEKTGMGGILNTSFNLHGEPNVCSPQDAIRTVDLSGLTHLAVGSYLLVKKDATT